jgi:glycosyltransferase involved in cell wall biosynthesis
MKLLIITQKVDRNDPMLGFFHHWLEEFARHCEQMMVICLSQGDGDLPENVKVFSLGKESGQSRLKYLFRFYKYIWRERKNYDAVFIHMNQEYVLLGGFFWKIFGKPIFMWRNHHAGSWLTDVAAIFCHKIFCTSKYSYTAKYPKTVLMPVGVDIDIFRPDSAVEKIPRSILFLGRVAPVKKPKVLMSALKLLRERGVDFKANFYGDALAQDYEYHEEVKRRVKDFKLESLVNFYPGVSNEQTPAIYNRHQIFVNLSSSGMYDKTIFEAAACGVLSVNCNLNLRDNWFELTFPEDDEVALGKKIADILSLPVVEQDRLNRVCRELVISEHSLSLLVERLFKELKYGE